MTLAAQKRQNELRDYYQGDVALEGELAVVPDDVLDEFIKNHAKKHSMEQSLAIKKEEIATSLDRYYENGIG